MKTSNRSAVGTAKPLPTPREKKPRKVTETVMVDQANVLARQLDNDAPTPSKLMALRVAAESGDSRAQAAFFATMMRKYGHLISVASTRFSAASAEYQITPNPKMEKQDAKLAQVQAELIQDVFERLDMRSKVVAMMSVLGYGYTFEVVNWETRDGYVVPKTVDHLAEDRVVFDGITNAPMIDVDGYGHLQQLDPLNLMFGKSYVMSGNPQTNGLFLPTSMYWMFHIFGWKDWAVYMERFAVPLMYTKVTKATADDKKREILRVLRDLGQDGVAVLADYINPETLELKSGNIAQFEQFIEATNKEVSKIWLGQTATVEGTPGSLGNEEARSQVREDLRESDCRWIMRHVSENLILNILGLNWGWDSRFIDNLPVYKIKWERPLDQEARGKVFTLARNEIGLSLDEKQVREELGLKSIEGVKQIIAPPVKAPVPAAFGKGNEEEEERAEMRAKADPAMMSKAKDDFEVMVNGFTEIAVPQFDDLRMAIVNAVRGSRTFEEAKRSLTALARNMHGDREISGTIFKALGLWAAYGRYDAQSRDDVERLKRSLH